MLKNTARSLLFIMFVAVCLSGCAKQLTREEFSKGDPGPYPLNFQELVKSAMETRLKDPYSAHYNFLQAPVKRYESKSPLVGGGVTFGWGGFFTVNAKNSFGAYVGARKYEYLIKDGVVVICRESF